MKYGVLSIQWHQSTLSFYWIWNKDRIMLIFYHISSTISRLFTYLGSRKVFYCVLNRREEQRGNGGVYFGPHRGFLLRRSYSTKPGSLIGTSITMGAGRGCDVRATNSGRTRHFGGATEIKISAYDLCTGPELYGCVLSCLRRHSS